MVKKPSVIVYSDHTTKQSWKLLACLLSDLRPLWEETANTSHEWQLTLGQENLTDFSEV